MAETDFQEKSNENRGSRIPEGLFSVRRHDVSATCCGGRGNAVRRKGMRVQPEGTGKAGEKFPLK